MLVVALLIGLFLVATLVPLEKCGKCDGTGRETYYNIDSIIPNSRVLPKSAVRTRNCPACVGRAKVPLLDVWGKKSP